MNKIEFKELNKEQMIIAFNQLKDDYHNAFEENEKLKSILKEIGDYIEKLQPYELCNNLVVKILTDIVEIAIKGIEGDK